MVNICAPVFVASEYGGLAPTVPLLTSFELTSSIGTNFTVTIT